MDAYNIFYLKLSHFVIQKQFLLFFIIHFFLLPISTAQLLLPANTNPRVVYACGNACTNIILQAAQMKSTTDYMFKQVPYQHYTYNSPNGFEDSTFYNVYNWDIFTSPRRELYSGAFNLPFPICFYDSLYPSFVLSTTGLITFDISKANCQYFVESPDSLPKAIECVDVPCSNNGVCGYPKACIMGVSNIFTALNYFSDGINLFPASPPDRKIQYIIEGIAPFRKIVFNYYKLATDYELECSRQGDFATFQMAVQETTGLIEINIENFSCPALTFFATRAICGIQNWARDKATTAPGKNATIWTAFHESYQFIPNGSGTRFINSKLLTLSGNSIAIADTSTNTATGNLNIAFNNICPTTDTTTYIVQTNYGGCQPFSVYDTVTVIKNKAISLAATANADCINNGTIAVQAQGDVFTYQLDAGITQSNNTFTNVVPGGHLLTVKGVTCNSVLPITVPVPVLPLQTINDTAICIGQTLTLTTTSIATQYNWQPVNSVSNATIASPVTKPNNSTTYILNASTNICSKTDSVQVTVLPIPNISLPNTVQTVTGDAVQLLALANNAVSVLWQPPTNLNNNAILQPVVLQPIESATYTLTATNEYNCIDTASIRVEVLPNCLQVNAAFTPNGDGVNDVWQLYQTRQCLSNIAVQVYNRYGSKVFESTNYNNNWKGTYNNKPLPDGTYYYVVTATLITGRKYQTRGNVTILR
jgi:gliding motility-associated-like protein